MRADIGNLGASLVHVAATPMSETEERLRYIEDMLKEMKQRINNLLVDDRGLLEFTYEQTIEVAALE